MTNANAAPVLEEALPYDLDAIREVFANNNEARRQARLKEVDELNRVMAESAQRQHELDQANEKLVASLLRRLAFTEGLLKSEREIRARLQGTIDTFANAIATASEPLQLGVEDAVARVHTTEELERNYREQYEPPKQPEPTGGGDGGGQPLPEPEPEPVDGDQLANDLQRTIDAEREANETPTEKPDPILPLKVATARAKPADDDDLEIPAFLRRNGSASTNHTRPPVTGHAEELFTKTAAVVVAAAQHVSAAARGHFGQRAA